MRRLIQPYDNLTENAGRPARLSVGRRFVESVFTQLAVETALADAKRRSDAAPVAGKAFQKILNVELFQRSEGKKVMIDLV